MTHISESLASELRAKLEEERSRLTQELAAHGQRDEETHEWEGSSAEGGETIAEESDPIDAADQIEELVTNVPLVGELEARLRDVEDALAKMDAGAYGMCEVGGEEIAPERLRANPSARTCIEHA